MSEHAGLFSMMFWMRAGLAAVYVGLPLVLVGTSVWWGTRRARRGQAGGIARRVRTGRLVGLGGGAAVGVVAIWIGQGLLAPASVAVGYLFGVLGGELVAGPPPSGRLRVASVETRQAARYLPRWLVGVAICAGVLTIVSPVLFTVLPRVRYAQWSPVHDTAQFSLPGATLSWPSVATSVPLAIMAALGLVVGGLAVRRVAALRPSAADRSVDEQLRRTRAQAAAGAVVGIELLTLAATLISASSGVAVPGPVGGTVYLASRILVWSGIGVAVLAVAMWCVLGAGHTPPRPSPDVPSRPALA